MRRLFKRIKFLVMCGLILFIISTVVTVVKSPGSNKEPKATIVDNKNTDNPTANNDTNILILSDNSNSMMLATIEDETKEIKLNPLSESITANLPKDTEKILASLENKLNINVDKFISMNYSDLSNIISSLDMKINIKNEDLEKINNLIPKFYAESKDANKGEMLLIENEGKQDLNSYQTLAYGSAIASNSEKQKELLLSFINTVKNMDYSQYPQLVKSLKSYISTNLTIDDFAKLASTAYESK